MRNNNQELEEASGEGEHLLDRLMEEGLNGRTPLPHFLPNSKAIVLCSLYKAGLGLAFEHGSGVLLARLPGSSRRMQDVGERQLWSAPCFVQLDGFSSGLTAGVRKADLLIGVLTDSCLQHIIDGRALNVGAEWNACLGYKQSGGTANYSDLVVWTLGAQGAMLDFCVSGMKLRIDQGKNQRVYGKGMAVRQLLEEQPGELPEAAARLVRRLVELESFSLADAFEPSESGSERAC